MEGQPVAAGPATSSSSILSPTAPQSYTVRKGDTLWGIASTFLRDPWVWPEIWYVNPQVENPHLIYPGDVLTLAYGADGRPQITLQRGDSSRLSPRVRSQPLEGAIRTIPYETLSAFLSKPMVLEKKEIKAAPYVVSSREQHLINAAGNTIYARGDLDEAGAHYNVMHIGEPLRDPDDNDVVGYQAHYAAAAKLTRDGDPATLTITESERETLQGDKLFPSVVEVPPDFLPRAPEGDIDGRIISLVNGIGMVGRLQAVVLNRGQQHGLEPGHVLGIYQVSPKVRDHYGGGMGEKSRSFGSKVQLPDERAGILMVFKTFDRISYGLIMESDVPIRELDRIGNP